MAAFAQLNDVKTVEGVAMEMLPSVVALRTPNGRYLGVQEESGLAKLVYNYPLPNERVKFQLEPAKCGGGLVNIRSGFNNKYWVRDAGSRLIVAAGEEVVEDRNDPGCTLFEPKVVVLQGEDEQNKHAVVFAHMLHEGTLVVLENGDTLTTDIMGGTIGYSYWKDYNSLVILPKRVAFVAHNGKYLRFTTSSDFPKFDATEIGSPEVPCEVITNDDGLIKVKFTCNDYYWYMYQDKRIDARKDDQSPSASCLLEPIKLDDGTFAFRTQAINGSPRFLTVDDDNYPYVHSTTIIKTARIRVVEPVVLRSINVTEYHLDKARIYGKKALVVATQTAQNRTSDPDKMALSFNYKDKITRSWRRTQVHVHLDGAKATIKAGIPCLKFLGELKVEVDAEFDFDHTFQETITETREIQSSYTATVPPLHEVTVRMLALTAMCDVPFSYKQIDTLINGETVEISLGDGVFTGVNAYDFPYQTKKKPLSEELWVRSLAVEAD